MSQQKVVGRRQLLSLFANDLKYLGSSLISITAWELAEIGTAKIDQERCLAYRKQLCNACYSVCPVEPRAIELGAYRYPKVRVDRCNGCGECVKVCLAPITAIAVQVPPLKVIMSEKLDGRKGGLKT